MKVSNCNVYGIHEALLASGFPMKTTFDDEEFDDESLENYLNPNNKNFTRGIKLGTVPTGTGHDSFLKLINVQMNITTSIKVWTEMQRYHFFDIGSSQSTMHRASKMNIRECCNSFVDSTIINLLEEFQDQYNSGLITFEQFIYNIPVGFELTARVTTNYLQLKTIYHQRKNHKLKEWRDFCEVLKTLYFFKELCLGE